MAAVYNRNEEKIAEVDFKVGGELFMVVESEKARYFLFDYGAGWYSETHCRKLEIALNETKT